jgi:glycosyltransferase involved in cell wall biosynthesis
MLDSRSGYSLLASAINHPDRIHPLWGLFNHRSLDALVRTGTAVTAVVPRPHAPPVGPYSEYRSIPRHDRSFSYPVTHPRFLYYLPKSLLYHRTGDSLASTLTSWYEQNGRSADITHGCHLYPDGYGLSRVSESHDIPLTAYAHGTIINEFQSFNAATRRRIRSTAAAADRIFCSGAAIQSKLREIEPNARTEVVPIGATPSHFPTDRQAALRQELNVPADATVVLFCGHLTEAKGVRDLLDVLPDLDDDLYFVFIGHDGELRADVQATLAQETTPTGKLLWQLDPVAVRRWFAVADLLVLPSYSEGRPTVIYEAMASQTAVLATDVGGVAEQVADGITGWVIDPGDTAALRSTLQTLSAEELQQMGMAAEHRLIEQGWTWEAHANAIRDAHETLLDST